MSNQKPSRREWLKAVAATAALAAGMSPLLQLASVLAADSPAGASPPNPAGFQLHYVLASALFGKMDLAFVLPEVRRAGCEAIDIWCLPHGNQREQVEEIGHADFAKMLDRYGVSLGLFTRYPLGPFKLADEIRLTKNLHGKLVVTGTGGPKDPTGDDAKREVKAFLEKMRPHVALAEEKNITIALENHAGSLLSHPDSLRAFADLNKSNRLGVAFAPHHLHAWADQIPKLITDLGSNLAFFYAQEHGKGFMEKLPKDQELMQLPGYGGGLDYKPIVAALKKIGYSGFTEIFMHPTPRGIPILPTATEITAAIAKSRDYLETCVKSV